MNGAHLSQRPPGHALARIVATRSFQLFHLGFHRLYLLFDFSLDRFEIKARATLHRREIDEGHGVFGDFLLQEDEARWRSIRFARSISTQGRRRLCSPPATRSSIPVIAYVTIGHDGPIAVRPANETILVPGDFGVVKNSRMVCRINSSQATRHHIAPLGTSPLLSPGRRPGQRKHGYNCDRATKRHR
jgi:hypothetical protein